MKDADVTNDTLKQEVEDKVDFAEGKVDVFVYETVKDEEGNPVLNDDGTEKEELVEEYHKDNLIVEGARSILSYLLGSANPQYKIDLFKLGKNGHLGTDILQRVPPTVHDTDVLDSAPFTKLYSSLGTCSLDPDTNITATLCGTAGGSWTPDATAIKYLPAGNTPTSVQFNMTIHKIEANGSGVAPYTEAGLFAASGKMFSRVTFPALVKTPERRIVFSWKILF